MNTQNIFPRARFPLGRVTFTANLDRKLRETVFADMPEDFQDARVKALYTRLLAKHMNGDWGCVDAEDKARNDAALTDGARIFSAYPMDPDKPHEAFGGNCIWIITEHDRSVTTLLLPSDY